VDINHLLSQALLIGQGRNTRIHTRRAAPTDDYEQPLVSPDDPQSAAAVDARARERAALSRAEREAKQSGLAEWRAQTAEGAAQRQAFSQLLGSMGMAGDPTPAMQDMLLGTAEESAPVNLAGQVAFNDASKPHIVSQAKKAAAERAKIEAARSKLSTSQYNEVLQQWAIKHSDFANTDMLQMDSEQLAELQTTIRQQEQQSQVNDWFSKIQAGEMVAPPLVVNEKGVLEVPPGVNEAFRIMQETRLKQSDAARQELAEQQANAQQDTKARDAEFDMQIKRIDQMEKSRLDMIPVDKKENPQEFAKQAAEIQREFSVHRQRTFNRFFGEQQPAAPPAPSPGDEQFEQVRTQAEQLGIAFVGDAADYEALEPGEEFIDWTGYRDVK